MNFELTQNLYKEISIHDFKCNNGMLARVDYVLNIELELLSHS